MSVTALAAAMRAFIAGSPIGILVSIGLPQDRDLLPEADRGQKIWIGAIVHLNHIHPVSTPDNIWRAIEGVHA